MLAQGTPCEGNFFLSSKWEAVETAFGLLLKVSEFPSYFFIFLQEIIGIRVTIAMNFSFAFLNLPRLHSWVKWKLLYLHSEFYFQKILSLLNYVCFFSSFFFFFQGCTCGTRKFQGQGLSSQVVSHTGSPRLGAESELQWILVGFVII